MIGRYRLEREIGRGGFGITYLGWDSGLDRGVAVKEYFPAQWAWRDDHGDVAVRVGAEKDFDWGLQRLQDEAKVLARVDHPNIVRVYAFEAMHGTGYIVMEFVDGEPLSSRLRRQGKLPECDIRQYVLPIMDGLQAVHDQELLHRDIKPANIMLASSGRGVLIDFGSARSRGLAESGEATVVHTPSYAAFEQRVGAPESAATDIYSLGAVLYHCVVGNPPLDPLRRLDGDRMLRIADAVEHAHYRARLLRMIDTALGVRAHERPQCIADWRAPVGDRELAKAGDADAQYRFARKLASEEIEPGFESAFWFRMAAGQGHPRAQYRLHRLFELGLGVARDDIASEGWETGAWHRSVKAQHRLAVACQDAGDDEEAEFWYRGAAHAATELVDVFRNYDRLQSTASWCGTCRTSMWPTSVDAGVRLLHVLEALLDALLEDESEELPDCCYASDGSILWDAVVEQDQQAVAALVAALHGAQVESLGLTEPAAIKDVVEVEVDASYQCERGLVAYDDGDWDAAVSWIDQAAAQGHAKALYERCVMILDPEHPDYEVCDLATRVELAMSDCTEAAQRGLACASSFLDRDIQAGRDAYGRQDIWTAEVEFRWVSERGDAEAPFWLAQQMALRRARWGDDEMSDFQETCEWFRRAARNGCARAEAWLYALLLGHLSYQFDIEQHELDDLGAEGMDWYWKASAREPSEQFDLGLRSEGDLDLANRNEAMFWYVLAAQQGHVEAQFRVAVLGYCGVVDAWDLGQSWAYLPDASVDQLATQMGFAFTLAEDIVEDRTDEDWLRTAASNGHSVAEAMLQDAGSAGSSAVGSDMPHNVLFADFAEEMRAESAECEREPRLLEALYHSYRDAAKEIGVSWARCFSSNEEIQAWYASLPVAHSD